MVLCQYALWNILRLPVGKILFLLRFVKYYNFSSSLPFWNRSGFWPIEQVEFFFLVIVFIFLKKKMLCTTWKMKQNWNKWLSTQQILSKFYAWCCHWYSISLDILPWIITDGHWFCLCSSQRSKINVKVRLKWVPTVSSDLCWKAHFKYRRNGSQLRPCASCIVTINGYK